MDASQVYLIAWVTVVLVRLTIQSSEGDKYRAGRTLSKDRQTRGIDLARPLFVFSKRVRLVRTSQFCPSSTDMDS